MFTQQTLSIEPCSQPHINVLTATFAAVYRSDWGRDVALARKQVESQCDFRPAVEVAWVEMGKRRAEGKTGLGLDGGELQ